MNFVPFPFHFSYGLDPETAEAWCWICLIIGFVIGMFVGADFGTRAAEFLIHHQDIGQGVRK